jgi:hypothetical protein
MKTNHSVRIALYICALLLISSSNVFAQENLPKYQIGINAGTFIYQGDLAPSEFGSFKTPSLVGGVNVSRVLSNLFAARLDLSVGGLRGDDAKSNEAWRQQRNFKFSTPAIELTAGLVYNPIGIDHLFNPYLFAGAGVSFVDIKRDYSNYNAAYFSGESLSAGLQQDIQHATPKMIPVIPIGVGLNHPISERLSLTSEATYRLMSTDYLDGFSQAANPDQKDHYFKFSLGLLYSFGRKSSYDCPEF